MANYQMDVWTKQSLQGASCNKMKCLFEESSKGRKHRRTEGGGDGPSPPPFLNILLRISQKDFIFINIRPPPLLSFSARPCQRINRCWKWRGVQRAAICDTIYPTYSTYFSDGANIFFSSATRAVSFTLDVHAPERVLIPWRQVAILCCCYKGQRDYYTIFYLSTHYRTHIYYKHINNKSYYCFVCNLQHNTL